MTPRNGPHSLSIMPLDPTLPTSRRHFIKTAAAASALAGVRIPFVHADNDDATQIAIVGCSGRGTGAVANALSVSGPPLVFVGLKVEAVKTVET